MATVEGGTLPAEQQLKEYHPDVEMLRVGSYFGLAMKAGMVAAGDRAAEKALKTGRAHLLVLARDISPHVAIELVTIAQKRNLPLLWWPDKDSLGLKVGKSRRGALAITDKGFAKSIIECCISQCCISQ